MRWGAVLGAAGVLLVVAASSRKASAAASDFGGGSSPSGDWRVDVSPATRELRGDDARRRLRGMAQSLERRYGIKGLADYLDATASTETGRTYAAKVHGDIGSSMGDSIGLFQMKTTTAFKASDGLKHLQHTAIGERMLETPDLAVIFAANHAVQAVKWARRYGDDKSPCGAGGPGDWIAVRRWWKYPRRVYDWCESEAGSTKTRERFERALDFIGVPHSFMYREPPINGWPGIDKVLEDYGITVPRSA